MLVLPAVILVVVVSIIAIVSVPSVVVVLASSNEASVVQFIVTFGVGGIFITLVLVAVEVGAFAFVDLAYLLG